MNGDAPIYDLVGIGFGPSNLALAVSIDECRDARPLSTLFLEKKSCFNWHPNMLLPGAEMQISFLKDLATQRNPASRYTFLSYLKSKGRLATFTNLRHFYPSRIEFNDYLCWAADKLRDRVRYGCRVVSVTPHGDAPHELVEVVAEDTASGNQQRYLARHVVVAPGGKPAIPFEVLAAQDSKRIWHSSAYLDRIDGWRHRPQFQVAVIGSGQSAAEIACDLYDRFPQAKVTCVFRGFGFRPADDSAFVNELFHPEYVDTVHDAAPAQRRHFVDDHYATNYGVVDSGLIDRLYRIYYGQHVEGTHRLHLQNLSSVETVSEKEEHVEIEMNSLAVSRRETMQVDAVVLATGYDYPNPPEVLRPLDSFFTRKRGEHAVDVGRDYRVRTDARLTAGVFVQGCNEATHGLSDTLLSILPFRAETILRSILSSHRSTVTDTQAFTRTLRNPADPMPSQSP